MAWFQLDAESVSRRVAASGGTCFVPSLSYSVVLGSLGFMAVSIAGFAPWAVTGEFFYRSLGEAGLYAVCAVVFIAVAGPLMHRLVIGPGSLWRFTALFGVSFAAYSAAWIAGWMSFGGHTGSVVGLLAGAVVMGAIAGVGFRCRAGGRGGDCGAFPAQRGGLLPWRRGGGGPVAVGGVAPARGASFRGGEEHLGRVLRAGLRRGAGVGLLPVSGGNAGAVGDS